MTLGPEVDRERKIAADPARPLDERLEAYENILESEVGDTVLTRARNIEREVGLRQLYLKFEGDNPSGTRKDRIAFAQVMDAVRRGFDAITVATCGNYGVAMAIAASLYFALSRANVVYAHLDRHLDLRGDPFAGALRLEQGILYPSDAPGFGVAPPA